MECTCQDWKNNIEKLNAPFILQAARSGNGNQYDGKQFSYCPWCGTALKDSSQESSDKVVST